MSGYLDEAEFMEMVKTLDPNVTEEEARRAVSEADSDNTGVITRQEFFEWWCSADEDEGEAGSTKGNRSSLARRLSNLIRERQVTFGAASLPLGHGAASQRLRAGTDTFTGTMREMMDGQWGNP